MSSEDRERSSVWLRPGIHQIGLMAGLGVTGAGVLKIARGNVNTGVATAWIGLLLTALTWGMANAIVNNSLEDDLK